MFLITRNGVPVCTRFNRNRKRNPTLFWSIDSARRSARQAYKTDGLEITELISAGDGVDNYYKKVIHPIAAPKPAPFKPVLVSYTTERYIHGSIVRVRKWKVFNTRSSFSYWKKRIKGEYTVKELI